MEDQTVLLYGQSMLISLVASSLAQSLPVMHVSAWEQVEACAAGGESPVLIFDLTEETQKLALPLLVSQPNILLIGLDAERNHAVVLSGRETHSFTMKQIHEIVEGRKEQTERRSK